MAALGTVFFDTSVLLGGLVEMGPPSAAAQELMSSVASGRVRSPATAWHCCLEFYSVATRLPTEFRLPPEMALTLLEQEIVARFEIRDLHGAARLAFLRACSQDRIAGGRVYDAHIGEIARLSDCRWLVSENVRHFAGLARHDIHVVTAGQMLHALGR